MQIRVRAPAIMVQTRAYGKTIQNPSFFLDHVEGDGHPCSDG